MEINRSQNNYTTKIIDISLYFLYWLIFFQIFRLFFAIYHFDKFLGIPFTETIKVFLYSIRPDISAACYIFVFIFFLMIFNEFIRSDLLSRIIRIYTFIWIGVITLISVTDAQLYNEWGTKINKESLTFFNTPTELFASIISSPIILLFIVIIVFIVLGVYFYKNIFMLSNRFSVFEKSENLVIGILKSTPFYIILFILLVIGIRGGIQLAPMNPSFAYFSKYDILNNTTINPIWNLGYSIIERPENREYYIHFTKDEVDSLLQNYQPINSTDTSSIFKIDDNPNIVLIIIESFTADVIESLGGIPNITPHFDSLIKNGISFENFYASGNRTYKSLPAIINGYPSLPIEQVVKYHHIYKNFPSLAHTLNKYGYFSSFYYGGETEFANMKTLVLESGFDLLVDQRDFDDVEKNSKWGAHDHVVFDRVLEDIGKNPKPFFTTILTLSNHEPFEIPTEPIFKNGDDPKVLLFKNTSAYTDKSIGDFIANASQEDWFENTIFVFTADHGHHYAKHRKNKNHPEMFHVPFVIYSNLLKDNYVGTKISKFSSQIDIPATLFSQIGFDYSDFSWSKNILSNEQIGFAYYGYADGFGWLSDENTIVYDNRAQQIINNSEDRFSINESLKIGQAYLQKLYQDFINY